MNIRTIGAAVALLSALAIAGCSSSPKTVAAAVSPTPSPTPTHLDERAACQVLAPALVDGQTVINDFDAHPDGSTIDPETLAQTVATLERVQQEGPPDLMSPVSDALKPLADLQTSMQTRQNTTISPLSFALAKDRLTTTCAPYSS